MQVLVRQVVACGDIEIEYFDLFFDRLKFINKCKVAGNFLPK